MYKIALVPLVAGLALAGCNQEVPEAPAPEPTPALETTKQKASYAFGVQIATQMKQRGDGLEPELLALGIKDTFADAQKMQDQEIMQVIQQYQTELRQAEAEKRSKELEANKVAGETFLKENATKEGVVTTESGLQYKIVTEGTGPKPAADGKVTVHYSGRLLDGTEFDSSYKRQAPATFPVGGVIPGWTEALQLMKEGAKWELYIPSNLAYGERGAGAMIGPNSTLIFDVELLSAVGEVPKPDPTPSPVAEPANEG